MTDYTNYWLAAITFLGYIALAICIWVYQRKKALEERGQITNGAVAKKWIIRTDKGATYKMRCTFSANGKRIECKHQVPRSEYNRYEVGDSIELIFDPQNPSKYNLILSQMSRQCCMVVCWFIVAFGIILGVGLGLGIGLFHFNAFHLAMTVFVIPFAGCLVFCGLLGICCNCKHRNEENDSLVGNYVDIETGIEGSTPNNTVSTEGKKTYNPKVQKAVDGIMKALDWPLFWPKQAKKEFSRSLREQPIETVIEMMVRECAKGQYHGIHKLTESERQQVVEQLLNQKDKVKQIALKKFPYSGTAY